eukprot:IDg3375t1
MKNNCSSTKFEGALLDTGAQRSVMGLCQAVAYRKERPMSVRVFPSTVKFKFGTVIVPSIGSMELLNVFNEIECVAQGWRAPIVRKNGHAYYVWDLKKSSLPADNYYTASQLQRVHKHLAHPSARKLYELLKRAYPNNLSPGTIKILEKISNNCATYCGTRFNAATFLPALDVSTVWKSFIKIWATMYIGMPESMLVDQGSVFVADEWRSACEMNNVELRETGTESHNSLSAGESYHSSKWSSTELASFGVMPRLPMTSRMKYDSQVNRIKAASAAISEYERIVSQKRLQMALNKRPPPDSGRLYNPGDMVYVYREKLKQYTGPHMVASAYGKAIRIHVGESKGPRLFNKAQLKPAPLENVYSEELSGPSYNPMVLHTEVLKQGDPRECSFDEAKREELLGLLKRGTFRIVLREEIESNPNVIPSRYVLAIKHKIDGSTRLKARLIVGGHRDREKNLYVYNSCTLQPTSVRILLALATILEFDIWMSDMRQGYLQPACDLQRKYILKPDVLGLADNELVQIIRPLYGLPESGEYWYETLTHHHRERLRFKQSTSDFALFFRSVADKLVAISGAYVDDIIQAGTKEEKERILRITKQHFDVDFKEDTKLQYVGLQIDLRDQETREISQRKFIERLQTLSVPTSYAEYRSMRARVAWLKQTRPDIACAVSMAAQTTEKDFDADAVKELNRIINYIQRTPNITLKFPKLDVNTLRLATYVDSSFNNRNDGSSQLAILFDIITRNRQTSEKRLMIDIRAAREAYNERDISNIALIESEHNPADALTKIKSNKALSKLLDTLQLTIHPPICNRECLIKSKTSGI